MDNIDVLIVDDSALMRNLVSRMVESVPGITVVAKAMNGQMALEKIPSHNPDVIILDLEMPVMTGLEFMRERKKANIHIPVIILSSIAHRGAAVTMECLELGASDFLLKPSNVGSEDIGKVADRLVEMVHSYGGSYARKKGKKIPLFGFSAEKRTSGLAQAASDSLEKKLPVLSFAKAPTAQAVPIEAVRESGPIEIIVFGISTGGPNALREVFADLSPKIRQPIVVVQHMPAGFTAEFAASLNNICPLEVKEAAEGDVLKEGRILIAPGGYHVVVEKRRLASVVHLNQDPPRNGHRPSADVLFQSVVKEYQANALGIIMTGMGKDGAAELAELRRAGSRTLGQDAESCIVYGMPRAAFELGAVQKQVPLNKMAETINELALKY
ncbi:chemotaxis response regulator protein-glutamate methylesterase [Treponema sp. OMZ 840]|uniref:protein-glutamate methylesterase/protein-glutamine glutaminase n=1 Tax=Treponema sp. OMZ 840 TaxID=244313 RepID=UPI003D91A816